MPGDPPAAAELPGPTAGEFDQVFSADSPGIRRLWELVEPELPPEVEPLSFISAGLLRHITGVLDLSPGQTLADFGCGRGGPGLWLAREARASLAGVDFSPVAVEQATRRTGLFGMAGRARFVVGDLTGTGLAQGSADAVVSIDAFHFAADPGLAAAEARRVLRPGRRLVLTNWQPKIPGDTRLPHRLRIDWPQLLRGAGYTGIELAAEPQWQELYTRLYRVALELGDPGDDASLAGLQEEARDRLGSADLTRRIVVTATAPADIMAPL